ncbi:MAG: Fis family transcriptional regulator, partial [Clostridia bacterium]|nr:Fis family transcriptional regulator [Clostridia bacterium]
LAPGHGAVSGAGGPGGDPAAPLPARRRADLQRRGVAVLDAGSQGGLDAIGVPRRAI